MKKIMTAVAAAGVFAFAATAAPSDAYAGRRGAVAAGVIGGLAAGAIIGGAIANSRPAYSYYAPAPGYVVYGGYAAPYPVACPGGYWARRPLYDRWGNWVGYSRPRFICPGY